MTEPIILKIYATEREMLKVVFNLGSTIAESFMNVISFLLLILPKNKFLNYRPYHAMLQQQCLSFLSVFGHPFTEEDNFAK